MLGSIGGPEIIGIVVVIILLFGVGKISGLGRDLGGSIKEFRKAIKDDDDPSKQPPMQSQQYQAQPPQQVAPPQQQQYAPPPPAQQPPAAQQQPSDPQKNIF